MDALAAICRAGLWHRVELALLAREAGRCLARIEAAAAFQYTPPSERAAQARKWAGLAVTNDRRARDLAVELRRAGGAA